MTAEIFQFPATRRAHNNQVAANQAERRKLADWFRSIAGHIEGNEVDREPLAAMIVLSSAVGDEVLHVGYATEGVSLREAGSAASSWAHLNYQRRRGNFYDRWPR